MSCNSLKLNNDKTEAFVVGSRGRVSVSQENHLRVGSHDISFKSHIKSLGVCIDATLSMAKHTDHNSRSACLEIRRISSIRNFPTGKATAQPMCSFFLSRLDYCNSLLIDITTDHMYRLQKKSELCSKSRFRKSRHEYVKPLLEKLHWLPVKERTLFKISTFAFLLLWYPATILVILLFCVHSIPYSPFHF